MYSYMISYDLINPNRDYGKLYEAIKKYNNWAHINESLWIIKSNDSSTTIRDFLGNYIDNNDQLFVAKLSGTCSWKNLSDELSDWLKKYL